MKIEATKEYVEKVLETYKAETKINHETGELRLGAMPIIWARAELLYSIYSEMEDLISQSATSVLRRIGKPYGSTFYTNIKKSGIIEKLGKKENIYLYLCSENLTIGWGKISIEETEDNKITVICEGGLSVGKGFKQRDKKSQWAVDSYFLGYLEGFFSEMHGRPISGEETECVGKGDGKCMMVFQ